MMGFASRTYIVRYSLFASWVESLPKRIDFAGRQDRLHRGVRQVALHGRHIRFGDEVLSGHLPLLNQFGECSSGRSDNRCVRLRGISRFLCSRRIGCEQTRRSGRTRRGVCSRRRSRSRTDRATNCLDRCIESRQRFFQCLRLVGYLELEERGFLDDFLRSLRIVDARELDDDAIGSGLLNERLRRRRTGRCGCAQP